MDSFALNGNFRIRGCEENVWTSERGSNRMMEKITWLGVL
jgi:hypothetical protein